MKKTIDIIIPFYNTTTTVFNELELNLEKLHSEKQISKFNIILVNDGSVSKNYITYIEKFKSRFSNFTFINLKENKGKGYAIKMGMKQSKSPFVIFYDIDFPFSRKGLYHIYHTLLQSDTNVDIAIAKRDETYHRRLPLKRKIISLSIKWLIFLLSKGKITDSQAGLKGFKKEIIPIFLSTKCNSFLFDFEFLLKAHKENKKIKEILVTPNANIEFTNFSNTTLYKEIKNLLKILIHKK